MVSAVISAVNEIADKCTDETEPEPVDVSPLKSGTGTCPPHDDDGHLRHEDIEQPKGVKKREKKDIPQLMKSLMKGRPRPLCSQTGLLMVRAWITCILTLCPLFLPMI